MRIALISCAKTKRENACAAKDLYISELFKKSVQYAEQNYDKYFILSALHGLLEPNEVIEPYDVTLNDQSRKQIQEWSMTVFQQIQTEIPLNAFLYFHAGAKYREHLINTLMQHGYSCYVPLVGMGIGKQLAFYKNNKGEANV